MNQIILNDIPCQIDIDALLKHVHVRPDDDDAAQVRRMAEQAGSIGRPKAAYQLSFIDDKQERQVVIDGIAFASRVLRVNLDAVHRVFPYIATCGMELEEWSRGFDDLLERYWADIIKELALATASSALYQHLQMHYLPGNTAAMNPGSLQDWPISEQKPFFELLGQAPAAVGVTLSGTYLMTPSKSVTGLNFTTDSTYVNCELCPREDCPNRRTPYDEAMYQERYGLAVDFSNAAGVKPRARPGAPRR